MEQSVDRLLLMTLREARARHAAAIAELTLANLLAQIANKAQNDIQNEINSLHNTIVGEYKLSSVDSYNLETGKIIRSES